MKRELRVDLGELAIALETDSSELHQYLDLETGRIVPVMDELSRPYNRPCPLGERGEDAFLPLPPFSSLLQAVYGLPRFCRGPQVLECGCRTGSWKRSTMRSMTRPAIGLSPWRSISSSGMIQIGKRR
jgi:hypothetical protein